MIIELEHNKHLKCSDICLLIDILDETFRHKKLRSCYFYQLTSATPTPVTTVYIKVLSSDSMEIVGYALIDAITKAAPKTYTIKFYRCLYTSVREPIQTVLNNKT